MTKNNAMVFAVAISAILLMSPIMTMSAFATDYTNATVQYNSNTSLDPEIYVSGTSHDGSVVVKITSTQPRAGQPIPIGISFVDANGNAIQHMHFAISAQQDGNNVLLLPHIFLNQGELKYNTAPLSSDNPVYVQVTILGIGLPYDKQHWTGPIGDVINLQIGQEPQPTPSLSVAADQSSYNHGDLATIKAVFTGYGSGQNIAITVTNPSGDTVISRTIVTDDSGSAELQFKISDRYQDGTYQVVATAFAGGMLYKDSAEFTVGPHAQHFKIVSVQATDQNGNPVSSFSQGSTGFAKVVVFSDTNQTALITADLFDSNLISLGVGSVKTTLGIGESQMIVSFYVPKDAAVGKATIFADAFTDWPSNGGVPLTGESSTTVEIKQ